MSAEESTSTDLAEFFADGVDLLLDVAECIPAVGLSLKAAQTYRRISDRLYIRKVEGFLNEISKVTPQQRKDFYDREESSGQTERFGEAVILILDKLDEMRKPPIIGRLMAAYMRGEITREQAFRLSAAVNRAFYDDLLYLTKFVEGVQGEMEPAADSLFALGLLSNRGLVAGTIDFNEPSENGALYELSSYGRLLAKFIS